MKLRNWQTLNNLSNCIYNGKIEDEVREDSSTGSMGWHGHVIVCCVCMCVLCVIVLCLYVCLRVCRM